MPRFVVVALLGHVAFSSAALAEVPSLTSTVGDVEQRATEARSLPDRYSGFLQKRKIQFHLGPVEYRIGGRGVKASVQNGGLSTSLQLGSDNRRLEFNYPSSFVGADFKFAIAAKDGISTYRIEFTRGF